MVQIPDSFGLLYFRGATETNTSWRLQKVQERKAVVEYLEVGRVVAPVETRPGLVVEGTHSTNLLRGQHRQLGDLGPGGRRVVDRIDGAKFAFSSCGTSVECQMAFNTVQENIPTCGKKMHIPSFRGSV